MKTTLMALLGLVCFTFMAAAADLNGKYTAEVPGRQGATQTTTFTFKTTGDKVEGTVANMRGETPIADGKLSGDTLTFSMTMNMRGTEMKIAYTGKVKGDTIDFSVDRGRGDPQTFTAKKAQ